ncbi:hypothetical protein [Flavobacterium soyae]|uniref:Uncharacterized protein n=1 Tax=Flavobacterium soyae TaxID=2903098 RepID=A0ABZ2UG04_9FLAO
MKTRHTCIFCGKKRFQERMTSFTFVSWTTPVAKSRVKHWACSKNIRPQEQDCFKKLLEIDFNPVIIP